MGCIKLHVGRDGVLYKTNTNERTTKKDTKKTTKIEEPTPIQLRQPLLSTSIDHHKSRFWPKILFVLVVFGVGIGVGLWTRSWMRPPGSEPPGSKPPGSKPPGSKPPGPESPSSKPDDSKTGDGKDNKTAIRLAIGIPVALLLVLIFFFLYRHWTKVTDEIEGLPNKYTTLQVPGDGLCLFHSVAKAIDPEATREVGIALAQDVANNIHDNELVFKKAMKSPFLIKEEIKKEGKLVEGWVKHITRETKSMPLNYPDAGQLAQVIAEKTGHPVQIFDGASDKTGHLYKPFGKKKSNRILKIMRQGRIHFEPIKSLSNISSNTGVVVATTMV